MMFVKYWRKRRPGRSHQVCRGLRLSSKGWPMVALCCSHLHTFSLLIKRLWHWTRQSTHSFSSWKRFCTHQKKKKNSNENHAMPFSEWKCVRKNCCVRVRNCWKKLQVAGRCTAKPTVAMVFKLKSSCWILFCTFWISASVWLSPLCWWGPGKNIDPMTLLFSKLLCIFDLEVCALWLLSCRVFPHLCARGCVCVCDSPWKASKFCFSQLRSSCSWCIFCLMFCTSSTFRTRWSMSCMLSKGAFGAVYCCMLGVCVCLRQDNIQIFILIWRISNFSPQRRLRIGP